MDVAQELTRYVELTGWIKELSSPGLKDVDSAEDYRKILLRNFSRIGELARINAEILDAYILPILSTDRLLTGTEIQILRDFYAQMMDAYIMENMDAPILYLISGRILKDAEQKEDVAHLIRSLDDFMTASYAVVEMTDRLCPAVDSFYKYRNDGLRAAKRLLEFLDKDRFAALPDEETKKIILVTSRYAISMYQHPRGQTDRALVDEGFAMLGRALEIMDDPFYGDQVPSYDWRYHEYRTLEYFCNMTEHLNALGLSKEQLERIHGHAERLSQLRASDPAYFDSFSTEEMLRVSRLRIAYLCGRMSVDEYRERLMLLSEKAKSDDYSIFNNVLRILAPLEYLLTIDPAHMTARQEQTVTRIYRDTISYVHRIPKIGNFTFMLGDITWMLDHFIEVPGGVDFETLAMELLAALHPPTYVHSLSVADLSVCIAKHLYEKDPSYFAQIPGYPDREKMREVIWHAAACHDIGKLFIVDTIITYNRDLFDDEFFWIKAHPQIASELLARHAETREYANTALMHHRFYDDTAGYPAQYNMADMPDKTLVAIVECADCLDASTDDVGRSYKRGKTLKDFIGELRDDGGSRFAPYLVELFDDEGLREDLEGILKGGRERNYYKTYMVLERVLK